MMAEQMSQWTNIIICCILKNVKGFYEKKYNAKRLLMQRDEKGNLFGLFSYRGYDYTMLFWGEDLGKNCKKTL